MKGFQMKHIGVVLSFALLVLAGFNSTEDNDYNYSDSSMQQNQSSGQASAQE